MKLFQRPICTAGHLKQFDAILPKLGITDGLIRLSVGMAHLADLQENLE